MSLLTVDDVAAHLARPKEWVRNAARSGRLPAVKVGAYWRFDPAQLEAWKHRHSNTALDPLQMTELSAKRQGLKK